MPVIFRKLNEQNKIIEFLESEVKIRCSSGISRNGVFRIGVSGGSIAKYIVDILQRIDPNHLRKLRIFFCDERFVPANDKNSTYGVYKTGLIPSTVLEESQIVGINTNLTLKECAQDYEEKILKEFHLKAGEIPVFDILFLGIGPDGHTCSLFPRHPALKDTDRLVTVVEDSPKPPPQRITMTFPLLSHAKCVMFLVFGEDKADIVKILFNQSASERMKTHISNGKNVSVPVRSLSENIKPVAALIYAKYYTRTVDCKPPMMLKMHLEIDDHPPPSFGEAEEQRNIVENNFNPGLRKTLEQLEEQIKSLREALQQAKEDVVNRIDKAKANPPDDESKSNKKEKKFNRKNKLSGGEHNAKSANDKGHQTNSMPKDKQNVIDLTRNCVYIQNVQCIDSSLEKAFYNVRKLANGMNAKIPDNSVIHIDVER